MTTLYQSPTFLLRKAAAICALEHGPDQCSFETNPQASRLLDRYQEIVKTLPATSDSQFIWNGIPFQLFCDNGYCKIQTMESETSWFDTFVQIVAGILTLGLAGCDAEPRPTDPTTIAEQPQSKPDVVIKDPVKAWEFCAKSGLVPKEQDCHLMNSKLGNKISTIIYLKDLGLNQWCTGMSDIKFDFDKLMSYLLKNIGSSSHSFQFNGNSDWPEGYTDDPLCYSEATILSSNDTVSITDWAAKIIPNSNLWTIRLYLPQSPKLCWAVYEAPCKP